MKILPESIKFVWDKGNQDKNSIKHNVTIQEAEQAFNNEEQFIFEDERHSIREERYAIFGETAAGRKLSIVFTLRNEKVRIITARDMSKKERRDYETLKNNTNI